MRLGNRSTFALLTVLALGAGATACSDSDDGGGSAGGGPDAVTVRVADNLFDPDEAEVGVGGTVTWQWVGNEPHNVVADDFESEMQEEGTFEHTFDEAGSYEYVCTIHPGMEGTIEVTG